MEYSSDIMDGLWTTSQVLMLDIVHHTHIQAFSPLIKSNSTIFGIFVGLSPGSPSLSIIAALTSSVCFRLESSSPRLLDNLARTRPLADVPETVHRRPNPLDRPHQHVAHYVSASAFTKVHVWGSVGRDDVDSIG